MAQGADEPGAPRAGDRAPDATDLSRPCVAHRLWLRERLERGHHVLVGYTGGNSTASDQRAFADLVERAQKRLGGLAAGLAMIASGARFVESKQIPVLSDPDDTFQRAYRARAGMVWLIRPDGHLAWRCDRADPERLERFLDRMDAR